MLGGNIEMINVKPNIKKIFEMSGLPKIIKIIRLNISLSKSIHLLIVKYSVDQLDI